MVGRVSGTGGTKKPVYEFYNLGKNTSYNLTTYPFYKELTADNFIINYKGISLNVSVDGNGSTAEGSGSNSANLTKSYNADTGVLTIGGTGTSKSIEYYEAYASANCSINYDVILVPHAITYL